LDNLLSDPRISSGYVYGKNCFDTVGADQKIEATGPYVYVICGLGDSFRMIFIRNIHSHYACGWELTQLINH